MLRLTIGTRDQSMPLKVRVEEKMGSLIEDGLKGVTIEEEPLTQHFIQLSVKLDCCDAAESDCAEGGRDRLLRMAVAHAVADMVVGDYEPKLVKKIITYYRPECRGATVDEIFRRCGQLLKSDRPSLVFDKDDIAHEVMAYIMENDLLNVSGFVQFRLRDYMDGLEDVVVQSIDDYEAEEEREEFVSLLRDYIADASFGIQTAHVLPRGENRLVIVNQQGEPFEDPDGEGLYWSSDEEMWDPDEVWDSELSWTDREEWLISSLVAIAPSQIVIHFSRQEHMSLMQDVFGGRLIYCGGCSRCMHLREGSTY